MCLRLLWVNYNNNTYTNYETIYLLALGIERHWSQPSITNYRNSQKKTLGPMYKKKKNIFAIKVHFCHQRILFSFYFLSTVRATEAIFLFRSWPCAAVLAELILLLCAVTQYNIYTYRRNTHLCRGCGVEVEQLRVVLLKIDVRRGVCDGLLLENGDSWYYNIKLQRCRNENKYRRERKIRIKAG